MYVLFRTKKKHVGKFGYHQKTTDTNIWKELSEMHGHTQTYKKELLT